MTDPPGRSGGAPARPVLEDTDLETNVLEFRRKSFSFDRSVDWEGESLALFHRTETESESRFRPRILRLIVAFPKAWLELDGAQELLGIARAGAPRGTRPSGEAVEAAAESTRFDEQGVAWRRQPIDETRYLYVPEEWADRLLSPEGLAKLGLVERATRGLPTDEKSGGRPFKSG